MKINWFIQINKKKTIWILKRIYCLNVVPHIPRQHLQQLLQKKDPAQQIADRATPIHISVIILY